MNQPRLRLFVFAALLFSALTSCEYWELKKGAAQVKQIALLSVRLNNASAASEDATHYPNINFVGEAFRSNLIAEWSSQVPQVRLFVVTNLSPAGFGSGLRSKLLLDEDSLFLRYNYDVRKFSSNEKARLAESLGADGYAILEGEASVWGQGLSGTLKVYDKSNHLVWKQGLKAVSTYIIKDENSPYISDYDELLNTLEKQRSHKTEILEVFSELGRNTAKSMAERFKGYLKLFEKPAPPKPKGK